VRETGPEMTRSPRKDADRNRLRILEAARALFAAHGLDVAIRDIARVAGVAPATIYRHFSTRDALIHAVLINHVSACTRELQAALDDPDPGHALRRTIESFARRQTSERGLNEALLGQSGLQGPFAAERRAHTRAFAQLVDRARVSGQIHPGLDVDDVRAVLIAINSIGARSNPAADTVIARLIGLTMAGMQHPASALKTGLPDPGVRRP
jgi:AcrR family transcriptional regulator